MSMVLLSHVTGNANSRQALLAFYERNMLDAFYTTLAWNSQSAWNRLLPASVSKELNRRAYPGIPMRLIHTSPFREACRLLSVKCQLKALYEKHNSHFSISRIYAHVDEWVAKAISARPPTAVYAYASAALETFRAARKYGVKTIYELPTAYAQYRSDLFAEEAALQPDFADTIHESLVDPGWTHRIDEELALADQVIVPSGFVRLTLPAGIPGERVQVIPYGAPAVASGRPSRRSEGNRKLRVLYVGALTQGKGLSYLLEAIHKVEPTVEFTIIGSRLGTCRPLDAALQRYQWTPNVPHGDVLDAMESNDVLVLPTLLEGFALVVLEAMSRGMAVITTPNSGALDVITNGQDGFIVPIRSSDALAEKLSLLANDRELLKSVSESALRRAQECTWQSYRELLASTVNQVLQPAKEFSHA
jgi:glycosyltransferase involved in cell wall biosynthesis